jgi:hypothetical protein
MKNPIIYSCVSEPDVNCGCVVRMSTSRSLTSEPPEARKRQFRGRVVAYWYDHTWEYLDPSVLKRRMVDVESFQEGWNSCKSGVEPCTSGGEKLVEMSDEDALAWMLGEKTIKQIAEETGQEVE